MKVPSVMFISLTLLTVVNYVYGEESTLTSLLQANVTETGVQDIKIQTIQNETSVEVDGTTTTTVNDNNTEIVKEMENSTSVITNSDKKNMNASGTPDEEEVEMTSNGTRSENHPMTTTETTLIKKYNRGFNFHIEFSETSSANISTKTT
ncbi:uncharacterized protein LOC143250462 [Tachypleus tridentatus]|uniref:uncharacterized protein LOC143250462 n=1 Tax=Tachypleus tridentatus TaxID=6853 RepID=UPI003FD1F7B0